MISNRRKVLLALGTGPFLFQLRSVFAQENSSEIKQEISSNQNLAFALRHQLLKDAAFINNNIAGALCGRETVLRLELHRTLASIPVKDLGQFVLDDRRKLVDSMSEEGIQLLPKKEEIRTRIVLKVPPPPQEECNETTVSLVVDIFLESLGLQEIQGAIKEVIENNDELKEKFDELAKAIKLSNWEQALELLTWILDKFSDVGVVDLFVDALGKKKGRDVWKRLLAKLSARFVPFVGQVYMVITTGVALFNNRDRIAHAVTCKEK